MYFNLNHTIADILKTVWNFNYYLFIYLKKERGNPDKLNVAIVKQWQTNAIIV